MKAKQIKEIWWKVSNMEFLNVTIMMSFLLSLRNVSHRFHLLFPKEKGRITFGTTSPCSEGTQIWLLYLYSYCTSAQYGIQHNDLHRYLRGIDAIRPASFTNHRGSNYFGGIFEGQNVEVNEHRWIFNLKMHVSEKNGDLLLSSPTRCSKLQ